MRVKAKLKSAIVLLGWADDSIKSPDSLGRKGTVATSKMIRALLCKIGIHRFKYPGGRCEFCPKIDQSFERETKWESRRRARN